MKKLIILFLVMTFFYSNLFAQNKYTENIVTDVSMYAGVYEGYLDVFLCCEMTETRIGTIVFFYDGESLRCLYDGLLVDSVSIINNTLKSSKTYQVGEEFYTAWETSGKFIKNNENMEGFLYYFIESEEHPVFTTSFLKKTSNSEMARQIYLEAENELNEFKNFESEFRTAFVKKNGSKLLTMINFPFYSKPPFNEFNKTKEYWQQNLEITDNSGMKRLMKDILNSNLNNGFEKYQNSDENVREIYKITSDKMYFYFKKIGSEFKLVYITGGYG